MAGSSSGAQATKFCRPILSVCRRHACFPPPAQPITCQLGPAGITDLTRMRRGKRKRQLTCREGAPKTRHQFRPFSAENAHSGRDSMADVFVCDAVRTPIGRFGGSLARGRADDLAAVPIKALMARHPTLDWSQVDEVYFGCANQAGEDNRNVARMALLLAGPPASIPGLTLNRLCASGLDAVGAAGRAIRAGEIDFAIAGGGESMTRAPFVMGKAPEAFSRSADIFDTTIGWRFINPLMKAQYGVDAMPETGENVAEEFQVSRPAKDALSIHSQQRAAKAQGAGFFSEEIEPVSVPGGKAGPITVSNDEHL